MDRWFLLWSPCLCPSSVGMDATNACYSTTYDIDNAHGTGYFQRFRAWVREMQV